MRVLALALAIATAASAGVGAAAGGYVTVATGQWSGHAWTLSVSQDAQGRSCPRLTVDIAWKRVAPPSQVNCVSVTTQPPPSMPANWPYGITFSSIADCPQLSYIQGVVLSGAATVRIALSSGAAVKTAAVSPPSSLRTNVKYFAAQLPCGPRITALAGEDAQGKVVARWSTPG